MNYLGLPLWSSFKATSIWNGVFEMIERKLTGGRIYNRGTTTY